MFSQGKRTYLAAHFTGLWERTKFNIFTRATVTRMIESLVHSREGELVMHSQYIDCSFAAIKPIPDYTVYLGAYWPLILSEDQVDVAYIAAADSCPRGATMVFGCLGVPAEAVQTGPRIAGAGGGTQATWKASDTSEDM